MSSYSKKALKNGKEFTGRAFAVEEFLKHLTEINFHFENGEIRKLSELGISKLKNKFKFQGYGANIAGLNLGAPTYEQIFKDLIFQYGIKYGFAMETE